MYFSKTIEGNIGCEVDTKKWDCNREEPHCHITYRGSRIGQVWLSSVTFSSSTPSELNRRQVNDVLDFVRSYKYEMQDVYNHNKNYGAD